MSVFNSRSDHIQFKAIGLYVFVLFLIQILKENFVCKQSVKTLIKPRESWGLILVYTVFLCLIKMDARLILVQIKNHV